MVGHPKEKKTNVNHNHCGECGGSGIRDFGPLPLCPLSRPHVYYAHLGESNGNS